jgi:hypothetical protein
VVAVSGSAGGVQNARAALETIERIRDLRNAERVQIRPPSHLNSLNRPVQMQMRTSIATQFGASYANQLRTMALTWVVAAALPLPVLVGTNPASSADISCVYLGLAAAWLVTEFHRSIGLPESPGDWRARTLAIVTCAIGNVVLFVVFGVAAGVQTHFPFPLMALLSALPAVGILPWMLRRVRHPYAAILFGASLVFAAKLAGCVVARIVYGPEYLESGYVAADWETARLMISLFWSLSTLLSLGLLLADYNACKRASRIAALTTDGPPPT